ncbi:bifunctional folylpolyglutamate synthase/dihydrofolate synthase [Paraliomyxa miuraensis]|uniref:bifunctional folylpolyglutamate synthase/dihydrofolate synthase n=1 Tax=Paraliomyxa miuraensis TaxID=376150 RepID=UPI0022592C58|nr:cyanophycin synthetase [Paraliomyxa miuraensis]MCX4245586.1 bifunctional folylpolyglutamate synthase/dihydrofolate synthase [Paraliomyxa miuraensis]
MTQALLARRPLGVRLDLSVVQRAYEALGHPGEGTPTIHVVGTNGKGSTVALLERGLSRKGLVTGALTSPHLHRLGERVRRAGRAIDDDVLGHAIDEVARVEAGLSLPRPLTFFELLTLAGLWWLATQGIDVSIVEAGLGARRDATRVVAATVVALTSIGLDHEAAIGPTLVDIAREKAGALRPGGQAFTVPQAPEVMAVLHAEAEAVGSRLEVVEPWSASPAGLVGAHQRLNAAVALAAGRAVVPGLEAADLDGVSVPGRLERLDVGAGVLCLDVAHNVDGIAAVVAAVEEAVVPRPAVVLFGCNPDKDRAGMLARLRGLGCPRWWVPIGEGPDPVVERSFDGPSDPALALALRDALDRGAVVLVCGSHALVGAVRARVLGRVEPDDPQDPRPEPRLSSRA